MTEKIKPEFKDKTCAMVTLIINHFDLDREPFLMLQDPKEPFDNFITEQPV